MGSTFWNVSYHTENKTTANQNAICIFEQDMGFPLSRHRAAGGNSSYPFINLGVVKGAALTIRAIATIGYVLAIASYPTI
jgi:primary-amine oxidase